MYVNVYNQGKYGVTIHWHGMKQPRNPWSDGPENITQCPISPIKNFTQKIIFFTEEGTLWWHAHSDWSRATVHGAIIIYPAKHTTYPFRKPDVEQTIVLASWYKADVMAVLNESQTTGNPPNVSDAFTINGQLGGRYNCPNGTKEATYRLLVDYNKTYLLRIINAVLNEEMFFSIAEHNLTVVGTDGAYVKQINTNYIMITPGQTMDVLVTTNKKSSSCYYMAATAYAEVDFDETNTAAIVQYSANCPSPIPFPSLPSHNDSDAAANFTTLLRSLADKDHPISVPKHVTKNVFMTVSVNRLTCPTCNNFSRDAGSLNNISFATPSIDYILDAYNRNRSDVFNETFPLEPEPYFDFTGGQTDMATHQGTEALIINYGEEVEIVFQGTNIGAPENHPMHLHGFSFYLVGAGSGNFNKTTDPASYNLDDPPEVNTIGVPKNGCAAIRFCDDNPGVWFMHCHLERHTTWGMATVLIVKDGDNSDQKMLDRPDNMPHC